VRTKILHRKKVFAEIGRAAERVLRLLCLMRLPSRCRGCGRPSR
jgi:hypothetical protein